MSGWAQDRCSAWCAAATTAASAADPASSHSRGPGREEYELRGDTTAAVAMGLERTGRIVTTAAALLAMVFVVLGSSSAGLLKLLGGGIAVALLLDATLIRALLLPALMRLLGGVNWWAPGPLRWLHDRLRFA